MTLGMFPAALSTWLYLETNAKHTAAIFDYSADVWSDRRYDAMRFWGALADEAHDLDIETHDILFDAGVWVPDQRIEEMAA